MPKENESVDPGHRWEDSDTENLEGSFWTGRPEMSFYSTSDPVLSPLQDLALFDATEVGGSDVSYELRWYHVDNVLNIP